MEEERDDSSHPTNALKMRGKQGIGPRVALTRLKVSARAPPIPGRHFNLTVALFNCFCFLAKQPTCPCDSRHLRGSLPPTVKVADRERRERKR